MYAASEGNLDIVKFLLEVGADIKLHKLQDNRGKTALMWAAYKGYLDVVNALVKARADVNLKDNYDLTALMRAAQEGHLAILQALVEAGSIIDLPDQDGDTALMRAAQQGFHLDIVQALVKAGADVNLKNKNGDTALMLAIRGDHLDVFKALLEAKPKLDLDLGDSDTVFLRVAKKAKAPFIKALVKAGADVDLNDSHTDFHSLLFIVAQHAQPLILDLLMSPSAHWRFPDFTQRDNIDRVDGKGKTALHHAIEAGNIDMIRHLRQKYRASIRIKDNNGKTAIELAADSKKAEIRAILNEPMRLSVDDRLADQKPSDSQDELVKERIDSGATSVDPIDPIQYGQLLRYSSRETLGDLASSTVQSTLKAHSSP
jgi:hypothetical protein